MPNHQVTRRRMMQAGVALLPGAAIPRTTSASLRSPDKGVVVGMATFGFREYTNERLAQELAKRQVTTIQLFLAQSDSNYWKYNHRNDVSDMTPARCKEIADTYRSAGIHIHSIGVYTNLIHPEESERNANLAYFQQMMEIGAHMDVHTFITEAGHFHSDGPEPPVPHHFLEDVWKQTVTTGKRLATMAADHESTVLVEPYFQGFFATAKRTRLFLEEVGSKHIRALLDPANLLELNDLEEMFDQLGPWIDCLHAKDRKLHVRQGVPAGQGDLDYPKFVKLAAEKTPAAPLIMEYVGSHDCDQALTHLRNVIRQVGLKENK